MTSAMASPPLRTFLNGCSVKQSTISSVSSISCCCFRRSTAVPSIGTKKRSNVVVAAVGEVSADGTTYLFIGAATVALLGTAFPVLFSRKDLCPECDGAGFVRKPGATLRANAARKDQAQIVCARCNGLGKLNQVDK